MRRAVATILMVGLLPSIALGQSAPIADEPSAALHRLRLRAAIVDTGPPRRFASQELNEHSRFDRGSRQTAAKQSNGHPVLIGAAIGAGAGFLINATACRTGESVCSGAGNLLMAGIGAGAGALVGLLISRR